MRVEIPTAHCSPPPPPKSSASRRLIGLAKRLETDSPRDRKVSAVLRLFFPADETVTGEIAARLRNASWVAKEDPGVLADLSAVDLHLAGLADRADLLVEGLEAASRALESRPDDPQALFNRALASSRLHLEAPSRHAWQAYLRAAPADGWSEEARSSLARLARDSYQDEWASEVEPALRRAALARDATAVREIVALHSQRSREWAEQDLLSEWAVGRGPEAERALAIAESIGAALAQTSGDRMLAEGAAALGAGMEESRVARLRAGHLALAAGLAELYVHWRLEAARDHFETARDVLRASHSPFTLWAEFYIALVDYYQEEYDRARIALEDLRGRVDERRYPTLEGRILWIEGLTAASTHRLEASAQLYLHALKVFCGMGEEQNLAAVHALRGEVLSKLGRYRESWEHLYNALARVDRVFSPIRHHAILEVAILNARRQGLDRAGLAFAEEHLPVARRTGSAQILHYAYMHRASLRHAVGDLAGTRNDLVEAARAAESLEDPRLRERSLADFQLASAEIEAKHDPARAVPLLSRTIRKYEQTHYAFLLPQAYGARAAAHLRLGQLAQAERDLARQLQLYEDSADQILRDVYRLAFLDQAGPAFDEMIRLQAVKLGRPLAALEYCERARYRALLDAWMRASLDLRPSAGRQPAIRFDLDRLQQGLPPDVAVLELALIDDEVLAWVITRREVAMLPPSSRRREVGRRVFALRRELQFGNELAAGRDLYDLLIRPIKGHLRGIRRLVVVPDEELFLLPFEALLDRKTGRFLIQDYVVSYSPSAALRADLSGKVRRAATSPPQVALAATGAEGGGRRYSRLEGAMEEARSIASLYPQGTLLRSPTKAGFLASLRETEVLHFSGHAVPNAEQPFASKLVLVDAPAHHVELYAYELYDRALPRMRLAVLSACGTGQSAAPTLGTAATLAGPFLAAGVPQVIASQWPVDDAPTRLFFEDFHRRLVGGADAATALRATKLGFMSGKAPELASPRVWASFVLLGG